MTKQYILALVGATTIGLTPIAVAQDAIPTRVLLKTETKVIEPKTIYEFSRGVGVGRMVPKTKGKPGSHSTVFEVITKGKKVISKKPLYSKKVDAVDEVIVVGKGGYQTSRGSFTGTKVLTMNASAYDPYPAGGNGGYTATGAKAQYGIVAVDPKVIPLGTLVFVEGYGFGLAADTGGAIKGNKIDLCYNSKAEAYKFGRKTVKVHILGKSK